MKDLDCFSESFLKNSVSSPAMNGEFSWRVGQEEFNATLRQTYYVGDYLYIGGYQDVNAEQNEGVLFAVPDPRLGVFQLDNEMAVGASILVKDGKSFTYRARAGGDGQLSVTKLTYLSGTEVDKIEGHFHFLGVYKDQEPRDVEGSFKLSYYVIPPEGH